MGQSLCGEGVDKLSYIPNLSCRDPRSVEVAFDGEELLPPELSEDMLCVVFRKLPSAFS